MEDQPSPKNNTDPAKVQFNNRYTRIKTIGQGSYGKIIEAFDNHNQQKVILKKFIFFETDDGIPSNCLREVSILKTLNHPNILKIQGFYYFIEERSAFLVTEILDLDLHKYIKENIENLQKDQMMIKKLFYQIVQGVYYLHVNNIIHRDLKPANILVSVKDMQIRIADFGLSRFYQDQNENYTNEVETLNYRAPELILGEQQYQTEIDIWSLGCIFFELHTSQQLFQQNHEISLLFEQYQLMGTPIDDNISTKYKQLKHYSQNHPRFIGNVDQYLQKVFAGQQVAWQLFVQMMQILPDKRAHIVDVIEHEYFRDIRTESL